MAEAVVRTVPHEEVDQRSTVLPRTMGLFASFVFAAATVGLASSGLIPLSTVIGRYPGAPILGILGVGALVCVINAYVFSTIGAAVRRSGADYILASRVLNPAVAFAFSAAMIVFSGLVVGKMIAFVAQSVLPVFLRSISMIQNDPGMLLSASTLASPEGISITGSILIVLAFALCILPQRANLRILQVGFGLIILGWLVVFFQLLFPAAPFTQSWDRFMGVGSYAMQVKMASQAGMPGYEGSSLLWGFGLLLAFWFYFGFQSPTYLAGEVKKPQVTLIASSIGTILVTLLVLGLGTFLVLRLVPAEWLSAQSFLFLSGGQALPWINFYAAVSRPDPVLVVFLTLAWTFSFLNFVQAWFIFCSRIILAWVEDGLMPHLAGYVHPQLKSPAIAVLIIAILSQFCVMIMAVRQDPISTDFGFIFFAIVTQVFPVLAALVMPFRKKDWFAANGKIVRLKIGPLPVISIASLFLLGYFAWLLANLAGTPLMLSQVAISLVVLVVVLGVSLVYFRVRRTFQHSQGVDIMENFKSFPDPHD